MIAAQQTAPDETESVVIQDDSHVDNGYAVQTHYKINRTYCFAVLKRQFPRWLTGQLPGMKTLLKVLGEIRQQVIQFVKGRSNPRPDRPKPHLYIAYKSFAWFVEILELTE